jgi:transcriptional antiterminator NusG
MIGDEFVMQWFIVHTYSGYEQKVKTALEERIKSLGKEDFFEKILVPTEKVVELVKGERKTSARKFYPGYILVRMELNDETWHIVKNTPKVTGFIGGKDKPTPLSDDEGALKPKPKYLFDRGDEVRVIDGPFSNFNGVVDEVSPEKGKVRVLVSIFGRSTPVELDFVQVTKI